jgi:hypothetical protein
MKSWFTAILLVALTIVIGAPAQADGPPVVVPVPPPGAAVQRDGPFRLLVAARADANHRRSQGFHAEPVRENGLWWVVYYHN